MDQFDAVRRENTSATRNAFFKAVKELLGDFAELEQELSLECQLLAKMSSLDVAWASFVHNASITFAQ